MQQASRMTRDGNRDAFAGRRRASNNNITMTIYRKHLTIGLSCSIFAISSALLPAATRTTNQQLSGMKIQSDKPLQLAPDDIERRGIEKFIGNDLLDANGEKLGSIKEFMIQAESGRVVYAVVSSGGVAGIGDTLRLLPFQAIQRTADKDGFTTSVQKSRWSGLPLISQDDFKAGRINLTEDQHRQLSKSYAEIDPTDTEIARYPLPPAPAPGSATATDSTIAVDRPAPTTSAATAQSGAQADFGQRMVRATEIEGKSVRVGNSEVGEVEDVVIDFERGFAMALVETESEFIKPDDTEFLISLSQLQLEPGQDTITTKLTQADFEEAQLKHTGLAANDARGERARRDNNVADEALTPTGRNTGATDQTQVDPVLQSATRAVKQMWAAHPELAKANLGVAVENGKLVLTGTVPSTELWERAKDTAEDIVRGVDIENRIQVEATRQR